MKILVTGCKGQVGQALVRQITRYIEAQSTTDKYLADKQAPMQLIAKDSSGLDITHQEMVNNVISEVQPDFIINASAYTAVDKAEADTAQCYRVNCDGPKNLAQAAERVGAVLLHISTDYVFDGEKTSLYTENDPPKPQSVYGLSKLAGEQAVAKYCSQHIILRTAWVFSEDGGNFVKTMLRLGAERDQLAIIGDQFGGPTYAGDIAAALITICIRLAATHNAAPLQSTQPPMWGVYHFSGLPHVSWFDFAQAIFTHAQQQNALNTPPVLTEIPSTAYPTAAKRPMNSRLNCSKIATHFAVAPSNWQHALTRITEYQ